MGRKIKNSLKKTDIYREMISRNPALQERQVEELLDLLIDTLKQALIDGKRIEVRDFGSFKVKRYHPRKSRNPRTGETVYLADRFRPSFQAGKKLRERVNTLTYKKNVSGNE